VGFIYFFRETTFKMTQNSNQTYLLVGTVTKDLLPDDRFTFGGTVNYAGVVAKNLGWRPIIVTAAAPDFSPPPYLAEAEWHVLPSPATTTFRNEYTPHGRRQTVGPIGRTVGPNDIPAAYRHLPLVHLCPLAQDLEPAVADVFDRSTLVTTPQGWLRQWNAQGVVSLGDWRGATEILPKLQATVISIEDIEGNWTIAERWAAQTALLIVTQDKDGCTVFHQGECWAVPPRPAQPVDPTGAGDVFAAAFFVRYHETGDLWQAAYFANVVASMAIERIGPEGSPARAEVEAYIAAYPLERAITKSKA
jgi:sugar/nucleoside kinase (ribokinase family)